MVLVVTPLTNCVFDLGIVKRLKPDITIFEVDSEDLCLPEVRPDTLGPKIEVLVQVHTTTVTFVTLWCAKSSISQFFPG